MGIRWTVHSSSKWGLVTPLLLITVLVVWNWGSSRNSFSWKNKFIDRLPWMNPEILWAPFLRWVEEFQHELLPPLETYIFIRVWFEKNQLLVLSREYAEVLTWLLKAWDLAVQTSKAVNCQMGMLWVFYLFYFNWYLSAGSGNVTCAQ